MSDVMEAMARASAKVSLDAYCEVQRVAGPLTHKDPGDEG